MKLRLMIILMIVIRRMGGAIQNVNAVGRLLVEVVVGLKLGEKVLGGVERNQEQDQESGAGLGNCKPCIPFYQSGCFCLSFMREVCYSFLALAKYLHSCLVIHRQSAICLLGRIESQMINYSSRGSRMWKTCADFEQIVITQYFL